MPIGPDSPNPMVIEMFLMLGLATVGVQLLLGVPLTIIEYIILVLGGLWFSLRLYWIIKSRDTHEKRSEQ